jgi:hypothetical protein
LIFNAFLYKLSYKTIKNMMTQTLSSIAIVSAFFTPFSGLFSPAKSLGPEMADEPPGTMPVEVRAYTKEEDKDEVEWLARIIYSETKVESEMYLIGWVARNRVETNYRGATYREVALSSNQFSGLNKGDVFYHHNISLGYNDIINSVWKRALSIAEEIYYAPEYKRPFPETVRHFYSPIVRRAPSWADESKLYHSVSGSVSDLPPRFAFYIGVK